MLETPPKEKKTALLISVTEEKEKLPSCFSLLTELENLCHNLAISTVDKKAFVIRKKNPAFFIGYGKTQEIISICHKKEIDMIIFDNELTPSQQRNWEKKSKKTITNRQEIIINTFAQRATTREAILQVELAKAHYEYPRLKRAWTHLSRQAGSLFLRGEGETQIEVDRRLIRKKIAKLKEKLQSVIKQRKTQRKKREKKPVPSISIIGYTNAGKSSLLNSLTSSHTYTDNKLFATLDPNTKKLTLPNKQELVLTDTVGFIRNLPHTLIEAFKSTLEEAFIADIILQVIDISDTDWQEHKKTNNEILKKLNVENKPIITIFNKIDLLSELSCRLLQKQFPDACFISTYKKKNISLIIKKIQKLVEQDLEKLQFKIPVYRYDIVAMLKKNSHILNENFTDNNYWITAQIPSFIKGKLKKFTLQKNNALLY